jgi:hypothetical protein
MGGDVTEPFYIAESRIAKVEGVHRRATIATGVTFEMGVHGPVKQHYRLVDAKDLPLPVDYVVAATAG